MAHGAAPTSNGNRVSASRWWRVRSTNTPYVPPRMCGGRVLLSGTRGGADVKREPGLCRALLACPLNQHALRPAADVWGAGITEWHTGRGRRQTGTWSLPGAGGVSAQPTHPTSRRGCVGGRVLRSGTRGGADVKREPGLCCALVVCPLNQRALGPAADVWGAGITEWHTGRGRRQTGTRSLPGASGVSTQPTHPTSRRGCVGGRVLVSGKRGGADVKR